MKFLNYISVATFASCLIQQAAATRLSPFHRKAIKPDTDHLDHAEIQSLNKRGYAFNGLGTFDQLIDHSNPSLGTFKQRYWYGTEFWNGPGSPIFLINMGEQSAEGFNVTWLSEQHLPGRFARETGGAVIIMEHRYWGESSPFELLTVENLTHLTLENSLKDITHLANNLVLPFDKTNGSHPSNAPWVYMGGSYPGAIAAWLAVREPGTFWAYYSSSGVVQAVTDFWQYYVPIQDATPANCSADISAVVDHVDSILLNGTAKQKDSLKAKFSLSGLTDADFAHALGGILFAWQGVQFDTEEKYGSVAYYDFCNYVEGVWPSNSTSLVTVPGEKGVGLEKALEGYSKYYREVFVPDSCEKDSLNVECWQLSNGSNPIFHDLSVNNHGNRQWEWMLCNEPFEYWFGAPPPGENGGKTLVSRLVDVEYWKNQCTLNFPELESGVPKNRTASDVNTFTGGWDVTNTTTRVMHTNGEWDPWRDATLSSKFRDGGEFKSTTDVPVRLVKGGNHCSDLSKAHWDANKELSKLMDEVVWNMKVWIAEYYEESG
ncbi:peptidase S28 [Cladorrhinum sp. PSN259]|nr:peptidase S28 [Cladorrhinum sp. PSN259]